MAVYYNEFDPKAAAWLRELIRQGHIAPGEVDERSIEDVCATELSSFTQCHFFAGIGGWPLALRLAGWPDERPVWTGSPPCQPFSAAGQAGGTSDERHLWPAFFGLIRERRPPVVFGEQVDAAIRFGWLDLVFDDLQREGYACGARLSPACSVGAPHIRQRINFVANANRQPDKQPLAGRISSPQRPQAGWSDHRTANRGADGCMANASESERRRRSAHGARDIGDRAQAERKKDAGDLKWRGEVRGVADTSLGDQWRHGGNTRSASGAREGASRSQDGDAFGNSSSVVWPRPTDGFWRDADWLGCTDGKWRPVEPGTQPLAHGVPARMVICCPCCKTETRIMRYGTSKKGRPREVLQTLRSSDVPAPTGKRGSGEHVHIQPEAILQSVLLWVDDFEACFDKGKSPHTRSANYEADFMRALLLIRSASGSPQGSEPLQQREVQSGGAMRPMSYKGTQQADQSLYLRSMWDFVSRCVASKSEQDLFCPVCERVGPHQRREEVVSRVAELRGYGNAIVVPQSKAFVEDVMEWLDA